MRILLACPKVLEWIFYSICAVHSWRTRKDWSNQAKPVIVSRHMKRQQCLAMTDNNKGLLYTFLGVLCVVPDSLFVRLITAEPLVTAFCRSLISGLIISAGLLVFQGAPSFRNILLMGKLGWAYCFLIGSTSPAFVMAVSQTSVANVVFIFASMPVFSAIFSSLFLGEHISRRTGLTIVFVGVGLAIIAYGSGENELANWTGDLWAVYVSAAYAGALTMLRRLKHVSMIPAIPIAYLGSALVLFPTLGSGLELEANIMLYILHGVLIALGTCFLTLGPRYINALEVSLLILLESVLAPLLVWAVISENPGFWALAGGSVVIGALLVSNGSMLLKTAKSPKAL